MMQKVKSLFPNSGHQYNACVPPKKTGQFVYVILKLVSLSVAPF